MTTSGKQQERRQSLTSSSERLTQSGLALAADVLSAAMCGTAGTLKQSGHSLSYVLTREMLLNRVATATDQTNEDKEMPQALQTAFSEALSSGTAMIIFSGSGATTPLSITHVPNWRTFGLCSLKNAGG